MATAPKKTGAGKGKQVPAKKSTAPAKKTARPATTVPQRKTDSRKPAPSANKKAAPKNTSTPAKVSPTPRARKDKTNPGPLGPKNGSGSIPYQGSVPMGNTGVGPVGLGGA